MHGDDRARPRCDAALEIGRVEVVGVRANVREDWFGAESAYGTAGGDESEWRNEHFIAGLNAACTQREDQGVCAGGDTNAVGDAAELCDFLFERGAFATQDKLLRRENAVDGGSNLRAYGGELRREVELRYRVE